MRELTSKPHILIVEDNEGDLFILQEALSELDFAHDTTVARDGQRAIEVITLGGLRPTLVLLNINLPRKSGFEVITAIKEFPEGKSIPIVMFTTSSSPDDIRRCYELGASSYLCKANEIDDTIRVLGKMKEYYLDTAMMPANTGKK